MKYMCAECGTEIEKPQDITKPKKFIFDNLFVAGSDVECPKCKEFDNEWIYSFYNNRIW